MKVPLRAALLLCLAASMFAQDGGKIFIVRHAEKQSDAEDAPLSAAGRTRAECLARTLRDAKIQAVFHSQYMRTEQTAAPLVNESHATETVIPARSTAELATAARKAAQDSNVLVVGHSNTIPEVLLHLGAAEIKIADDAYDLLFIVNGRNPKDSTTLHYCASLPAMTPTKPNSMAK